MEQATSIPPARNAHRWLTAEAKLTLAAYGITQRAWMRWYPACDRCGCPDDRCIGFHHGEHDPAECDLRYWIEDDLKNGRLCGGSATGCEQDADEEHAFGEVRAVNPTIDHGARCPVRMWMHGHTSEPRR